MSQYRLICFVVLFGLLSALLPAQTTNIVVVNPPADKIALLKSGTSQGIASWNQYIQQLRRQQPNKTVIVNLKGVDLGNARLNGADLRNVDLRGANLQNADLQGADLRGANLQNANLNGANLQNADLRGAKRNLPYRRLPIVPNRLTSSIQAIIQQFQQEDNLLRAQQPQPAITRQLQPASFQK